MRAVGGDGEAEQAGGAGDDLGQFGDGVELQADRDAEPVAQRRGQQALPRGRADQREARQVDADRSARDGPSPIIRSSARSSIAG